MTMDRAEVERRKRAIEERVGPWYAHDIHLGHGVYTIGESERPRQDVRLPGTVRVASDLLGGLEGKRILDLACMEGMFALELASRGAEVVGIEGRADHVERARFAQEMLGLDNAEFLCEDVRNLANAKHGEFDLVLLLGILYHLEGPEIAELVKSVAGICRRAVLVDTHFSITAAKRFESGGREYWGRLIREHDPTTPQEERRAARGSSLDNPVSMWPTRASLFNLVGDCGFTSVYEVALPRSPYGMSDRTIVAALKGEPLGGFTANPSPAPLRADRFAENEKLRISRHQRPRSRLEQRVARLIPPAARRAVARRRRA
jgi:SAM-dependent methyltransferase